uniref:Uncharacterized protein n=1 Tax=Knipowitschia caucasica TaxID=637954 RepID=A0AAV2JRY4_KNICA
MFPNVPRSIPEPIRFTSVVEIPSSSRPTSTSHSPELPVVPPGQQPQSIPDEEVQVAVERCEMELEPEPESNDSHDYENLPDDTVPELEPANTHLDPEPDATLEPVDNSSSDPESLSSPPDSPSDPNTSKYQPVFVSGANKPNKLLGLTSSHFESDSVRSMVRLLFLRWIIATALRPTAITF